MEEVWKPNGVSALYRIRMENAPETQIRLNDGRRESRLDMADKPHALYRLGQWLAEIFAPTGAASHMELSLFRPESASGRMRIDFLKEVGAVTITLLDSTQESRRFENVSRVEIDLDAIRVDAGEISDASNGKRAPFDNTRAQPPESDAARNVYTPQKSDTTRKVHTPPENDTARNVHTPPESDAARNVYTSPESDTARKADITKENAETRRMEQELRLTKEELSNAERMQASLEQELSQTRTALAKAEQDLDAERRYNARLQIMADGRLEELLTNLERESQRLDRALKEKLSETETLSEKVREANKALSDKAAEAERLNQELENSCSLLELKDLDCQRARQTLDSLRNRSLSDEDTLELMQSEPFLKGNSVRKTLEAVERELDAAETRLGRIIRLREKINGAVQTAILVGNGTLPLSEELGGNRNGGGRPTPGQSPENGTGFERGREPTGASEAGD